MVALVHEHYHRHGRTHRHIKTVGVPNYTLRKPPLTAKRVAVHVRYWHLADISSCAAHVRYWG